MGYLTAIVEYKDATTGRSHDLFTFGDLLGFNLDTRETCIFQTTTTAHHVARFKKITACVEAYMLLSMGIRIKILHWEKHHTYIPTMYDVLLSDFPHNIRSNAALLFSKQRALSAILCRKIAASLV